MTDDEIKELWLKLLNAKTYAEAFALLREAIPFFVIEEDAPQRCPRESVAVNGFTIR